jgi:SOS-response transcriptional repressor LexA
LLCSGQYAENFKHLSTENFPHGDFIEKLYKFSMFSPLEIAERARSRADQLGITPREASLRATGKPDMITSLARNHKTDVARLARLADALEMTLDELAGIATPEPIGSTRRPLAPEDQGVMRDLRGMLNRQESPRDLPVHGTALGGGFIPPEIESQVEVTHVMMGETIDYVRRPPALMGRTDVYALYVIGTSMEPRFEPGETLCVDPRKPPSIGDDVVVQLARQEGDDREIETCLIKKLVRMNGTTIELRQYNPDCSFKIQRERVAAIHRVFRLGDLLSR